MACATKYYLFAPVVLHPIFVTSVRSGLFITVQINSQANPVKLYHKNTVNIHCLIN